jgi:hypothetical protein
MSVLNTEIELVTAVVVVVEARAWGENPTV